MEKILAPLNIIVNNIMLNQMSKLEIPLIENNSPKPVNIPKINHSDVVIHTVEDDQAVRDFNSL